MEHKWGGEAHERSKCSTGPQHQAVLLAVALVHGQVSVMVTKMDSVSFQHLTKFSLSALAGLPGKERPLVSLVFGAISCRQHRIAVKQGLADSELDNDG